jgi:hypothetical protein
MEVINKLSKSNLQVKMLGNNNSIVHLMCNCNDSGQLGALRLVSIVCTT